MRLLGGRLIGYPLCTCDHLDYRVEGHLWKLGGEGMALMLSPLWIKWPSQ